MELPAPAPPRQRGPDGVSLRRPWDARRPSGATSVIMAGMAGVASNGRDKERSGKPRQTSRARVVAIHGGAHGIQPSSRMTNRLGANRYVAILQEFTEARLLRAARSLETPFGYRRWLQAVRSEENWKAPCAPRAAPLDDGTGRSSGPRAPIDSDLARRIGPVQQYDDPT